MKHLRFRKLIFWTILALINAAVIALMGETFLRLSGYRPTFNSASYKMDGLANADHFTFDPKTGYALIPNISDRRRGITTDEHGNRITSQTDIHHDKAIVLVGDSTVFGWGVRDEDTFAYKMARDPRFAEYTIINAGVPGYSLGHIVAVLDNKVLQYNPALIIISVLWPWKAFDAKEYGGKDGWKTIDFEFYRKLFPIRTTFSDTERMARWRLPVFLHDLYFRARYSEQIRNNLTRPGIRDFDMSPEQERDFAAQHISALLEAVGRLPPSVKVLFYVHPYQYTIFSDQFKSLGAVGYDVLLRGLNAPDLKPQIFASMTGDPLYIDGSHLTPAGHNVFARLIGDLAFAKLQASGEQN